jgi:hypothetical protein
MMKPQLIIIVLIFYLVPCLNTTAQCGSNIPTVSFQKTYINAFYLTSNLKFTYSTTTGNPTEYFIDWDKTFDVNWTPLEPSFISTGTQWTLVPGEYKGQIFFRNSSGCISPGYQVNLVVVEPILTTFFDAQQNTYIFGIPDKTLCAGTSSYILKTSIAPRDFPSNNWSAFSPYYTAPSTYYIDWDNNANLRGLNDTPIVGIPSNSDLVIGGIPNTPGIYEGFLYTQYFCYNGGQSACFGYTDQRYGIKITIEELPSLVLAENPLTVCLGTSSSYFSATSISSNTDKGNIQLYGSGWNWASQTSVDYNNNMASLSVNNIPNQIGIYSGSIYLQMPYNPSRGYQCTNQIPVSVNVIGSWDGIISSNVTSICLGQSVTISSAGGKGTPYYWASTNGGTSWNVFSQQYGGQYSFTYTPTQAGTYRFHLRNQNSCGFCFALGTCTTYPYVDVVVNAVSVSISPSSASICTGSSTTLSASGLATYSWSPSTGLSTTSGATVTASPTSTTTYTVSGTTAGGCAGSKTVTVTVSAQPSGGIIVSPSINIYNAGYANLSAPLGTSYAWSTGATSRQITVYSAGSYSVYVTNGGCGRSFSVTVTNTGGSPCGGGRPPCYLRQATDEPSANANDEPDVAEFSVFPNPAVGQFTVALPERVKDNTPLTFYDMMGKELISSAIPKGQWKVSVSLENISEGMYLVKIGYGHTMVKKVMVKK